MKPILNVIWLAWYEEINGGWDPAEIAYLKSDGMVVLFGLAWV
jgi:hypothetical protein